MFSIVLYSWISDSEFNITIW